MSEQLSTLMDGELPEAEMMRLIAAMKNDDALKARWAAYHLLGDSLRKSPPLSPDFAGKVMQQLAHEPTVLAPRRQPAAHSPLGGPRAGYYALPVAASFAAIGLVGILAWQMVRVNQQAAPAQIAVAPVPQVPQVVALATPSPHQVSPLNKPVTAQAPAHVRFSHSDANSYLLAHQEFSPIYAMEGIPAYVRTVSEDKDSAR